MSWNEARAATLLLSEERVGWRVREAQAREDAALARSLGILRAEGRGRGPR